jgi:hypothetical protein
LENLFFYHNDMIVNINVLNQSALC